MTVIIAQDTPDAVRGILKRWFIEPKPNVFVGTMNRSVRQNVLLYIRSQAAGVRMLVIHSSPNCQGFEIEHINDPDYSETRLDGLWLVSSPESGSLDCPF